MCEENLKTLSPIFSPSETTIILEDFPDFSLFLREPSNLSNPIFCSGINISSAPAPIPALRAIWPDPLPITSIKKSLLWELAVSLILSIAFTAVFSAVSYPNVHLVPTKSLSIVPGIPIVFIPCSSSSNIAPVSEPFPPITTRESISYLSKLVFAFFLPSFVLNSKDLADLRIVPPLLTILFTPRALSLTKSSIINPSKPL